MNKFKLKIASNDKVIIRIFKCFPRIASHVFSIILFLAITLFIGEKLVPILEESKELEFSIRKMQSEVQKQQEKLTQIKLTGPFSRQWRPKHYQQFADLCYSDTSVYKKLTQVNKSSNVIINDFKVQDKNREAPGFEFSLDVLGAYPEILKFLTNFENQFFFVQIKKMDLSPKPAEKRYIGGLRFHLEGWLW